ncbi:hypothetical protein KFL_005100050 [Klebsormidium nitens]|uniref:N-acetyl-D-glucosamine kinase n=1 Tax=Klebsormidium nitens TaxID=105231 RepID=A0A1Y1IED1_KLENI|nr:hypothetical protein KFL_005100050 [Klebsormidium nitens]|eukprot:GAQ89315.1 hypothetical protein KFL_005100050 [Klebsormidium nitens]
MADPAPWSNEISAREWIDRGGAQVVLGVDGGGTNTSCVVMECAEPKSGSDSVACGNVLGGGSAGSSNYHSVGEETAHRAIEAAIAKALSAARVPRAAVQRVCMGMSGVDRPSDIELVLGWIRSIFPDPTVDVSVHNDAIAALATGTGGKLHGCVLIAGTGTIAYGVAEDGRTCRAAGAGPALGDRGSGHAIASEALSAVMRADDGRGPETKLTGAILAKLGLSKPEDLIGWAYKDHSWARVAALVPVVKDTAAAGDAVALRILEEAVEELASTVEAVVRRLKLGGEDGTASFPLVLVGGVLSDGSFVAEKVTRKLTEKYPHAKAVISKQDPAVGAAMLAWQDHTKRMSSNK